MPSLFSRKSRTTSSTTVPLSPQINNERAQVQAPASPPKALPQRTVQKREDAWAQKEVLPEDVQELLHLCTQELKSKGEAIHCCSSRISRIAQTNLEIQLSIYLSSSCLSGRIRLNTCQPRELSLDDISKTSRAARPNREMPCFKR